jgi:hypothetical protein
MFAIFSRFGSGSIKISFLLLELVVIPNNENVLLIVFLLDLSLNKLFDLLFGLNIFIIGFEFYFSFKRDDF